MPTEQSCEQRGREKEWSRNRAAQSRTAGVPPSESQFCVERGCPLSRFLPASAPASMMLLTYYLLFVGSLSLEPRTSRPLNQSPRNGVEGFVRASKLENQVRSSFPGALAEEFEQGRPAFQHRPGQVFYRHAGGAREPKRVGQALHAPLVDPIIDESQPRGGGLCAAECQGARLRPRLGAWGPRPSVRRVSGQLDRRGSR